MEITRRQFVTAGTAAATAAALGPAFRAAELLEWTDRPAVAWAAGRVTPMPVPSPEQHLLDRASWGPTSSELARLRSMGMDAWIEEQLDYTSIDDSATEQTLAAVFPSLAWSAAELRANRGKVPIRNELIAAMLYRAVNSKRQLFEVMVDHWSNHFNLFQPEEYISVAKTLDDREVVRRNALGSFRDMLHASAASPAMMRYLNTFQNTKQGPNENYGREVMELHTLGVDGGYTEADVKQVARCFTGWGADNTTWAFVFTAGNHDDSPKTVLGRQLSSSGAAEGHEALDILVDHPSTARHVARRLVRRFVGDQPPESLVDQMAAVWGRDGDIKAMMRVLLRSAEFKAAVADTSLAPAKIRRPLELWVAALRVLAVNVDVILDVPPDVYEGDDNPGSVDYTGRVERYLQLMDHVPFRWLAPNGYPDTGDWWGGMHVMISRFNYGLALAEGRLDGIQPDFYAQMQRDGVSNVAAEIVDYWRGKLLFRPLLASDQQILVDFLTRGLGSRVAPELVAERLPMLVALMLDSPYFQWR